MTKWHLNSATQPIVYPAQPQKGEEKDETSILGKVHPSTIQMEGHNWSNEIIKRKRSLMYKDQKKKEENSKREWEKKILKEKSDFVFH